MIEIDFDDPTYVAIKPFTIQTQEGDLEFDAGDPIQVSLHNNREEFVIGSGDTLLCTDGQYAKNDLLSVIEPARFEEVEDDSGIFFMNTCGHSESASTESIVARMTTLNEQCESSNKFIRITKINIKNSLEN